MYLIKKHLNIIVLTTILTPPVFVSLFKIDIDQQTALISQLISSLFIIVPILLIIVFIVPKVIKEDILKIKKQLTKLTNGVKRWKMK